MTEFIRGLFNPSFRPNLNTKYQAALADLYKQLESKYYSGRYEGQTLEHEARYIGAPLYVNTEEASALKRDPDLGSLRESFLPEAMISLFDFLGESISYRGKYSFFRGYHANLVCAPNLIEYLTVTDLYKEGVDINGYERCKVGYYLKHELIAIDFSHWLREESGAFEVGHPSRGYSTFRRTYDLINDLSSATGIRQALKNVEAWRLMQVHSLTEPLSERTSGEEK